MSNKATVQPAYNSDINTWNVPVNQNTQNIDDALGTTQTFALTGVSGTVAVTGTSYAGAYPANTASYIPQTFYCSGVPTGAVTLQIPSSIGGRWIVNNVCTGTYGALIVASAGAGSSVNVAAGATADVYSDGTNIFLSNNTSGATVVSSLNSGQLAGNRNRLINGDMSVSQRYGNTLETLTANTYSTDRWTIAGTQSSKLSFQRISTSAPPYPNSIKFTSLSSYSLASSDVFQFYQPIEALNVSDFQWGTAIAQPVTLSFYVYSSLTGTFGGSIRNYALTRSYPFTYAISSANTWTYISITIPGDTSGSWVTGSAAGSMYVTFSLGTGSTFSGSAGSWVTGDLASVTGAVSVVSNNGATWYVTNVQLELGAQATPYEQLLVETAVNNCLRYYQVLLGFVVSGYNATGGAVYTPYTTSPMRTVPAGALVSTTGSSNINSGAIYVQTASSGYLGGLITSTGGGSYIAGFTLSAEL